MVFTSLPELFGVHALHPVEEAGEGGNFSEVLGQQPLETDEDFFDALRETVLADAVLLDVIMG